VKHGVREVATLLLSSDKKNSSFIVSAIDKCTDHVAVSELSTSMIEMLSQNNR